MAPNDPPSPPTVRPHASPWVYRSLALQLPLWTWLGLATTAGPDLAFHPAILWPLWLLHFLWPTVVLWRRPRPASRTVRPLAEVFAVEHSGVRAEITRRDRLGGWVHHGLRSALPAWSGLVLPALLVAVGTWYVESFDPASILCLVPMVALVTAAVALPPVALMVFLGGLLRTGPAPLRLHGRVLTVGGKRLVLDGPVSVDIVGNQLTVRSRSGVLRADLPQELALALRPHLLTPDEDGTADDVPEALRQVRSRSTVSES